MRSSVFYAVTIVTVALLAVGPPSTTGSLLPWLDRGGSPLSDRFPDPFRILEHTPFGLERDDVAIVSMARVDWRETPTSHEIVIDVPGMKKDELKIEMEENRILRVSGERKREEEKKGEHWHRVERSHGKFWRQFRLPDNVDLDSVSAKLEDGVLTVTSKKLAPDQIKGPRVVSIAGGDGGVAEKLTAGEAKKIEL
ncbi:22.0 kDa class IV heat shock protein-like [Typha latifolia]|uniref:22.0 kDa class IV heat shock protein-like n=1 Tax=Typha latifolia TaxID=4733 RepID=UPI003C2F4D18